MHDGVRTRNPPIIALCLVLHVLLCSCALRAACFRKPLSCMAGITWFMAREARQDNTQERSISAKTPRHS